MKYEIRCSVCGQSSRNLIDFKCPSCGNPLEVQTSSEFKTTRVLKRDFSVWRYRDFFPYVEPSEIITLGEGWTPLVKFSESLFLKLESSNPTGSFKDRGSTTLISALGGTIKRNGLFVSEDSSGNAGASMAAYAGRAGLKARIYVPETVSGPKFAQIQHYGANVVKISGSRSKVAEEAQRAERRKVYIGHIFHPLFRDGIKSLAYEIAEQSSWKPPERVYLPVSAGTLLLGVLSGFKHLVDSKVIKTSPKIVACQIDQVSPLYHRFKDLEYVPPRKVTSAADALVSVNPPLLELMNRRLSESSGDAVLVEENEMITAFKELAGKGFFVEPSSAVAYAAYKKQIKSEEIRKDNASIVVLTGTGLKTSLKPQT